MRRKRTVLVILAGAVLAACVRTSSVMLGGVQGYAPIDPSQVTVFVSEADIPGDYVKVAYISAEGAHGWTSEEGMVQKAQQEAAKLGANGIVINEIAEPSAGEKIAGGLLGIPAQRTGRLLAVRYDDAGLARGLPFLGDYTLPIEVPVYSSRDAAGVPETVLPKGHVLTVVGRDEGWATVRYAMKKEAYLRVSDIPSTGGLMDVPEGPCADSLYQALLKKDVNDMTEREFLVFRDRDQACSAYRSGSRIR